MKTIPLQLLALLGWPFSVSSSDDLIARLYPNGVRRKKQDYDTKVCYRF